MNLRDAGSRFVPPALKPVVRDVLVGCGVPLMHRTEDRRVLETVILPDLTRREDVQRVLFVGCEWYTKPYQRLFFRRMDYWTLDYDPHQSRYGAGRGRHIVGGAQETADHFPEERFDLIVCNGVYGWGLDDRPDVERAFDGFFRCLRPGGLLLLGWNDLPGRCPLPPGDYDAMRQFDPYPFAPLGAAVYPTDTPHRHVFGFWQRPMT